MWKEKFVYVLNYFKTFKAVHKNNPHTHGHNKIKKPCGLFQSLYSRKVAGTITAPCLPLFTKKGASGVKQKNWTQPVNSAYSN